MKITKTILACLAVLAFFALTTRCARAGDVDCTSVGSGACSTFGGSVASANGTLTGASGESASFNETVYQNGTVFTYVFTITNNSTGGILLNSATIFTNAGGGGFGDNFNCPAGGIGTCLNYGEITTSATEGDTGFDFKLNSLTVGIASLPVNGSFTFYVQGAGTTNGTISVSNSGPTGPGAVKTAVSEPNALTLLGSLLFVLLLGMPVGVRLRQRTV